MPPSRSTSLRYQQSDPDVRLMLRVRDDDAGAFEELVRRYQPRLVRMMQSMAPRGESAEDLAQEVFIRIFKARKRYVPGAKLSTWVFTIASNVTRNAARSASRRREFSEADTTSPSHSGDDARPRHTTVVDASGLLPTRLVEGAEQAEVVRHAVGLLGERQREALILSRFEGMSYEEIASTMSLSPQAVKSLLSRARVNLKEILQPYLDLGVIPTEDSR